MKLNILKIMLIYILIPAFFHLFHNDSIIVDILRIIMMLFLLLESLKIYIKQKNYNKKMLYLLIFSFILSFIIFGVNDHFKISSVTDIMKLFYPTIIVLIFVVLNNNYQCSEKQICDFCFILTIFGTMACLYNIISNFKLIPHILSLNSSYDVNFASYFGNRNEFGYFLLTIIGCSILYQFLSKNKKMKIINVIMLIIMLINLFFTFSRASIFAVVIFITLSLFLSLTKKQNISLIIIMLSLTIVLMAVPDLRKFVFDNIIRLNSGLTNRDTIFAFCINYFKNNNWLIGNGYIKPYIDFAQHFKYIGFHNTFLTILMCQGIAGFVLYSILIIYGIYNSCKLRKYNKIVSNIFISFTTAYIFHSLFESNIIFGTAYYNFIVGIIIIIFPLYLLNFYKNREYEDNVKKSIKVTNGDLISIIVPIYNCSEYIEKCISHLQKQIYKNFELILVDDGSTDNSYQICLEKAKSDKRIKVFHQNNSGVSAARNLGIKKSKGKYVCFNDSDDYIDDDYLLILYSNMVQYDCDISIVTYSKTFNNNDIFHVSKEECLIKLYDKRSLLLDLSSYRIGGYIWNKMYKKELIDNLFDINISYREDTLFNLDYIKNIKRAVYCNKPCYHYVQRAGSALNSKKYNSRMITNIYSLNKILKVYKNYEIDTDFIEYQILKTAFNLKYRILSSKLNKQEDLEKIDNEISKYYSSFMNNNDINKLKKIEIKISYKYPLFMGFLKKNLNIVLRWLCE